jgi:hypothetical protein
LAVLVDSQKNNLRLAEIAAAGKTMTSQRYAR